MSEELSRVEDLLENGVEQPVLPMSELEAILRGEKIKPHSRVAELLLQYNPSDILIEKSITENGTYYASADNAAGYFKVIVDTPVIPPVVLDHLVETITENGTYNYTSEHDGYSDAEITVNVPSVQPVVASKTITANGTYVAADEQLDGYSQAVVDVPGPVLGTKSITDNGTYDPTDDNLDGYSSVTVGVPPTGLCDIPNTPTPIATFTAAESLPLKSLTVGIEPQQDLHGYDSPWVGGAGKNKLPLVLADIKARNTSGTWSGNNYTRNGVTFSIIMDESENITGIKATGTATANTAIDLSVADVTNDTQVILNGCPSGGSETSYYIGISTIGYKCVGSDVNYNNYSNYVVYCFVASGYAIPSGGIVFTPMVRLASVSDPTFEPYSNICPISGWSACNVVRSGKNLFNPDTQGILNARCTATDNDGIITITASGADCYIGQMASEGSSYSASLGAKQYVKPNTTYYLKVSDSRFNKNFISFFNKEGVCLYSALITDSSTLTTPSNCCFVTLRCGYELSTSGNVFTITIQLEEGNQATTYEPYAGTTYTIPFVDGQGQSVEVFGGSVDVVNGGEQQRTLGSVDLGELEWGYDANIRCWNVSIQAEWNMKGVSNNQQVANATAEQFKLRKASGMSMSVASELAVDVSMLRANTGSDNEAPKGLLVYELATPTTFCTQPTSIKSLDGENNVSASTGNIEGGQYFSYVYPELGTKTITENGTYNASSDQLDGYSGVTVNVPSGGNTPIVYHYSNDRKICVGENTIDGTCTWYFMGYYLAENDTAPPEELLAYLPSDDGVLQSENYVSDQDLTQNGWCGFYNRNLRLWTLDTSSLQTGYLWGVVNTFEKNGTIYYPQHNGYFEPEYIPKEIKLGNWFTLSKDSATDAKDNLNVNQYNITWNGGVAIGSGLLGNFDISNYSKVKVKLITGASYYNTIETHELRKIWCGLTPQKYTSMFDPSSITWNSIEKYYTDNSETIIELTPTTGVDNYINITTYGWNVDIEISLFE